MRHPALSGHADGLCDFRYGMPATLGLPPSMRPLPLLPLASALRWGQRAPTTAERQASASARHEALVATLGIVGRAASANPPRAALPGLNGAGRGISVQGGHADALGNGDAGCSGSGGGESGGEVVQTMHTVLACVRQAAACCAADVASTSTSKGALAARDQVKLLIRRCADALLESTRSMQRAAKKGSDDFNAAAAATCLGKAAVFQLLPVLLTMCGRLLALGGEDAKLRRKAAGQQHEWGANKRFQCVQVRCWD